MAQQNQLSRMERHITASLECVPDIVARLGGTFSGILVGLKLIMDALVYNAGRLTNSKGRSEIIYGRGSGTQEVTFEGTASPNLAPSLISAGIGISLTIIKMCSAWLSLAASYPQALKSPKDKYGF